ncbi:cell division protein ZapA [Geomonas subterranea]|uniref:Cell division protein ZapA n=1 Tax=Geomonas subterranea TaxID=2847989 RepID=A0ABX8LFH6_9BACT|nr:cell division protein ZapA [Geomonas subterranea]QXE90801.1 cell division protein ZapA [Geomonas subterranea]QXM11117.1 cell division protein ZapA [Geomonas subterranea]
MIATHSIRVLGRELQVKSVATPEHVAQVEALVNEKLAEAEAKVSGGDTQLVVILALMNLAEACLDARKQLVEEQRTCSERVAGLIERLDRQQF